MAQASPGQQQTPHTPAGEPPCSQPPQKKTLSLPHPNPPQVAFGVLATSAGLDIHDWSSDYRSPYWFHDFAIDFSVPSLRQVPPGRVLVAPLQFLYIDSYHLCPMRHYGPLQYVRMIWHSDPRCMECTNKKEEKHR